MDFYGHYGPGRESYDCEEEPRCFGKILFIVIFGSILVGTALVLA